MPLPEALHNLGNVLAVAMGELLRGASSSDSFAIASNYGYDEVTSGEKAF